MLTEIIAMDTINFVIVDITCVYEIFLVRQYITPPLSLEKTGLTSYLYVTRQGWNGHSIRYIPV